METGKLMKENCGKKTSEIVGIEINCFYPNFYLQQGGYVFARVCLSVCVLA